MARRCEFIIEGKKYDQGKSWWRRQCKNLCIEDSRFCWNHASWAERDAATHDGLAGGRGPDAD